MDAVSHRGEELINLGIRVIGIGKIMFMPVQVEIYFVVHQHRHQILCNIKIVSPPLTEHGMMLDTSPPNNGRILTPLGKSLINPIIHIVSSLNHTWKRTVDNTEAESVHFR